MFPYPGCFEKAALRALKYAEDDAIRLELEEVGIRSLLLGIMRHQKESESGVLSRLGLDLQAMERELTDELTFRGRAWLRPIYQLAEEVYCVFFMSIEIAKGLRSPHVTVDHILLALSHLRSPIISSFVSHVPRGIDAIRDAVFGARELDIAIGITHITESEKRKMHSYIYGFSPGVSDTTPFVPYPGCFELPARSLLSTAAQVATNSGLDHVGVAHILWAAIFGENREGDKLLNLVVPNVADLDQWLRRRFSEKSLKQKHIGDITFSLAVCAGLCRAIELAIHTAAPYVTVVHIIAGVLCTDAPVVVDLCNTFGLKADQVEEYLRRGLSRSHCVHLAPIEAMTLRFVNELELLVNGKVRGAWRKRIRWFFRALGLWWKWKLGKRWGNGDASD